MPPKTSQAKQSLAKTEVETADEHLFFYTPNEKNGEFCQWYRSVFVVSTADISSLVEVEDSTLVRAESSGVNSNTDARLSNDEIAFGCAEQFMMYCKAARFVDESTMRRVLATPDPKEQKRLGRKVAGFSDRQWEDVKDRVVVAGNRAKFGQNPSLLRKLLATGDRMLCEAASKDRIWGIGYTAKQAMKYRDYWGENRLGNALMVVREQLRDCEEEGEQPRVVDAAT